jgi:YD repeat-containing protein
MLPSFGTRICTATFLGLAGAGCVTEAAPVLPEVPATHRPAPDLEVDLYPGPCVTDVDEAGEIERITYTYTGELLATETHDKGADGKPDLRVTIAYEQGRKATRTEDQGADGTPDEQVSYEYDKAGALVAEHLDHGVDDVPDGVRWFTYNGDGSLREVRLDIDLDGLDESRVSYEWKSGLLVGETTYHGASDVPEEARLYAYDDQGRLIEKRVELHAVQYQRTVAWVFTYDDGGHLVVQTIDLDDDGQIDQQYRFEHNAFGLVAYEELDIGVDRKVDRTTDLAYDPNGNLVSRGVDEGDDGSLDSAVTHDYGCWE